jgi:hypothetical protein
LAGIGAADTAGLLITVERQRIALDVVAPEGLMKTGPELVSCPEQFFALR